VGGGQRTAWRGQSSSRRWVKPLLKQIRNDEVANVITQLAELKPQLVAAAAKAADQAVEYYQNNQKRMKYKQARQRKNRSVPALSSQLPPTPMPDEALRPVLEHPGRRSSPVPGNVLAQ